MTKQKYILGSVGTAEAFKVNSSGERTLAFVAKTLTDSAINISTTKDEIRAGTGAPVVATFTHDPQGSVTLTDVFFKPEYVEAQLGVAFGSLSAEAYQQETITVTTANTLVVAKTPVKMPFNCEGDANIMVWYTKCGTSDWKTTTLVNDKTVTAMGAQIGDKYTIRYLATDEEARDAVVTTNIIPQELFLIIETPVYAGDACAASQGKPAGSIQYEIPRFKLDGAQDFSNNMSSNTTMSLSGSIMATEDCDGARMVRIISKIADRKWYTGLTEIEFEGEDTLPIEDCPDTLIVYGIYDNDQVASIPAKYITFTKTGTIVVDSNGNVTTDPVAGDTVKAAVSAEAGGYECTLTFTA